MLRILVLAAAVCVATGTDVATLAANVSALWQHVRQIEEEGISSQVNLMVHGGGPPRGHHGHHRPEHHGPHDSHEDEDDEEPEEDDGDDHGHGHGHGHGPGGVHLHVHVDGMGMRGRDPMHTVPFAPPEVADLRIHARADIVGDLSGYIDFRQRFGGGRLEARFDVSGFSADMVGHEHALRITRFGAGHGDDACGNLGGVFSPPHRGHGERGGPPGRGGHHGHHGDHDEEHHRARRDHHGTHDHTDDDEGEERPVEGDLGTVSCDADGALTGDHEYRRASLVGFHGFRGRAIAIYAGADDDGDVIGCGTVYVSDATTSSYDDVDEWLELMEQ